MVKAKHQIVGHYEKRNTARHQWWNKHQNYILMERFIFDIETKTDKPDSNRVSGVLIGSVNTQRVLIGSVNTQRVLIGSANTHGVLIGSANTHGVLIGSANTQRVLIGSANTQRTRVPSDWIWEHVHSTSYFDFDLSAEEDSVNR